MWVFPLVAALVALWFALALARRFAARRRPHHGMWALALLMYAAASLALFLGVLDGWTGTEFRIYWLLGAVLNVPFLAQGELQLLVRNRAVTGTLLVGLVFATAFAVTRVGRAPIDPAALAVDLPLGREAFAADPFAVDLARIYALPAYVVLVGGALWSAARMRRADGPRDRFLGTLAVALGATIVAAGSALAATGLLAGFSLTLATGVGFMFWGFLRASRPG